MPISMFDTRTMLEMLDEVKPAGSFLRRRFFVNARVFDTENVDVDIIKHKRKMAPFVSNHIGGKTVDREGFSTNTYKPLLVAPDMITTAEDMLKRAPGEAIYGGMSPDERAAEQLGRDMVNLEEMVSRREEWMCAKAIFTAAIPMIGEGINQTLTFGFSSGHDVNLGSGSRWNESGVDPLADLRDAKRKNVQDSGVSSDTILMGSDAMDAFLAKVGTDTGQLSQVKVNLGQIDPQELPEGVTYWGYLKGIGDVFTYDEWYVDDEGNEQPLIPVKDVLIGSSKARTDMCYGAIADADEGTFVAARAPKSWTQPKPSARFIQLRSRPLPVPTQIDAFSVLTVLA